MFPWSRRVNICVHSLHLSLPLSLPLSPYLSAPRPSEQQRSRCAGSIRQGGHDEKGPTQHPFILDQAHAQIHSRLPEVRTRSSRKRPRQTPELSVSDIAKLVRLASSLPLSSCPIRLSDTSGRLGRPAARLVGRTPALTE